MIEIIDCPQNTPEWLEARRGLPTASNFATVLASGKGGGESLTRKKYMRELAGEIITGAVAESYSNGHMERGHVMEAEAREMYAFAHDAEIQLVGFIKNGRKGCSPDSLVGADGMAEIKSKLPHLLIDVLERDRLPPEHVAQCQGGLWVAEREWIDFIAYWPKLPLFVKRVYRDEDYIAKLAEEVDRFNAELDALVEKVRGYGVAP